VYGVAFLVRPIGGLVLGAFADRHGRRAALSLTVVLMGVSVAGIVLILGLPETRGRRPRPSVLHTYAPGRASSTGSGSIGEPPSYQPGAVQYSKCR
jgi:MFS family permease